jgi:hypothetical protein
MAPMERMAIRQPEDRPSVGLILCKERNRVVVEYALRDTAKPIGGSAYRVGQRLPARLKGRLPTVDELEAGLRAERDGAFRNGRRLPSDPTGIRTRVTDVRGRRPNH